MKGQRGRSVGFQVGVVHHARVRKGGERCGGGGGVMHRRQTEKCILIRMWQVNTLLGECIQRVNVQSRQTKDLSALLVQKHTNQTRSVTIMFLVKTQKYNK